jgi:hypothetical protein
MAGSGWRSERNVKKNAEVYRIMVKEETRAHIRKVIKYIASFVASNHVGLLSVIIPGYRCSLLTTSI